MSIGKKISLTIICMVVVTAIGLGFYSLLISTREMTQLLNDSLLDYSQEASERIHLLLDSELNVLEELSNGIGISDAKIASQSKSIKNAIERLDYIDLAIIDTDGYAFFSKSRTERDLSQVPIVT